MSCGLTNAGGAKKTVFTRPNTAVFTPMPSASTVTAAIVNAGAFNSCRKANLKSRIISGVVAERGHWIGAGCAKSRDVTGEQRDGRQRDCDKNKGRDVKRANIVQQRGKQPSRQKSENHPNNGTDSDQLQRVPDNEAQNITTLRTQGHAHANFVRPLNDVIRNDSVCADRGEHQCDCSKNPEQDDR